MRSRKRKPTTTTNLLQDAISSLFENINCISFYHELNISNFNQFIYKKNISLCTDQISSIKFIIKYDFTNG